MCECVFRTPIYNLSRLPHALHPAPSMLLLSLLCTQANLFYTHSHALRRAHTHTSTFYLFLSSSPRCCRWYIVLLIIMPSKQPLRQQYANIFIEYMNKRCDIHMPIESALRSHYLCMSTKCAPNTQHFIRLNDEEEEEVRHICAHSYTKAHQTSP